MISKQRRAELEFVQRMQGVANDIRRAMTPDWLIITEGTKVDVHDISSVERGTDHIWRVRMKNGVEFAIPDDQLASTAAGHPTFSL